MQVVTPPLYNTVASVTSKSLAKIMLIVRVVEVSLLLLVTLVIHLASNFRSHNKKHKPFYETNHESFDPFYSIYKLLYQEVRDRQKYLYTIKSKYLSKV